MISFAPSPSLNVKLKFWFETQRYESLSEERIKVCCVLYVTNSGIPLSTLPNSSSGRNLTVLCNETSEFCSVNTNEYDVLFPNFRVIVPSFLLQSPCIKRSFLSVNVTVSMGLSGFL